jgi:Zn-dependent peptidase ImmA (M78 family)
MAFRRGFKTEANVTASEIRTELGLTDVERLDPLLLAEHLDIPVMSISELAETLPSDSPILHLIHVEPEAFSALTVFRGTRRMIVHNDAHSLGRVNSNIAHELAHALLHHPVTPGIDERGCRIWDQTIEDEANWLASVLLIPDGTALAVAWRNRWETEEEAAQHFGVSMPMLRYRLAKAGAYTRVARSKAAKRLAM